MNVTSSTIAVTHWGRAWNGRPQHSYIPPFTSIRYDFDDVQKPFILLIHAHNLFT